MRVALAQIDPTVGALTANAERVQASLIAAHNAGADLVVLPELALCGYPPKDLLLHEGFLEECTGHLEDLAATMPDGLTAVIGLPLAEARGSGRSNALRVIRRNEPAVATYRKRLLPTYDVFDEDRYFEPGDRPVIVEVAGVRVGLSVCEDLWRAQDVGFAHRYLDEPDPVTQLVTPPDGAPGAQLIVNPSASPFGLGKSARHRALLRRHATTHGVHVAAINQVGGNDQLIFDGHSAVFDPSGRLIGAAPGFEESLLVVDLEAPTEAADPIDSACDEEQLYRALVLGVRDYMRKTGFASAVIGLSGGIDSAVTAVIGAAAIGGQNVTGLSMPSRYSSDGSKSDAHALASNLGMPFHTVPIADSMDALESVLPFEAAQDVTHENLQSRLRGTIVMALSNKQGQIVLTTGNKSELAVGYCTLYGDMNGGLAVLSDVDKLLVYRLARWMNANPDRLGLDAAPSGPPIPEATITKPPSAELSPGQQDSDSLPPYEVLDEIIERYVEARQHPTTIVRETGFDASVVSRIVRLIDVNEYKRQQAATGLKVTSVAFGVGRRMPIAQGWRPERGI